MEIQEGYAVDNIQELFRDSDFLNEQAVEWGRQEKIIYSTIEELKHSWAGGFSKMYTDSIEQYQPDVVSFANILSHNASTLGTVANMYRELEDKGTTMSAEEVESITFNETDTGKSRDDVDDAFSPEQCKTKAGQLNDAAEILPDIIHEMDVRLRRIYNNYSSPEGTALIVKTQHMVHIVPKLAEELKKCATFLVEDVGPEYQRIEKTNAR